VGREPQIWGGLQQVHEQLLNRGSVSAFRENSQAKPIGESRKAPKKKGDETDGVLRKTRKRFTVRAVTQFICYTKRKNLKLLDDLKKAPHQKTPRSKKEKNPDEDAVQGTGRGVQRGVSSYATNLKRMVNSRHDAKLPDPRNREKSLDSGSNGGASRCASEEVVLK